MNIMNHSYTIKQIILGLRKEYLEYIRYIKKLNSLISYDDKEIKNMFIYLYNLELYYRYQVKDSKLNELLNGLKTKFNLPVNSNKSITTRFINSSDLFDIVNSVEFNKILKEAKNTNFYKNIDSPSIPFSKDDVIMGINFNFSGIHYHCFDLFDYTSVDDLYYNSLDDTLRVRNLHYNIDIDQIRHVLDIEIDGSLLSDYINNLLGCSRKKDKTLILPSDIKKEGTKLCYKFQKRKNGISLVEK